MSKVRQVFSRKALAAKASNASHGVLLLRLPAYASSRLRMIQSKSQEIGQDLTHAILISQHGKRRRRQEQGKLLVSLLDLLAHSSAHIADEGVQVEWDRTDHDCLCFQPRHIEHIINER